MLGGNCWVLKLQNIFNAKDARGASDSKCFKIFYHEGREVQEEKDPYSFKIFRRD
jgi:hypothetical protein